MLRQVFSVAIVAAFMWSCGGSGEKASVDSGQMEEKKEETASSNLFGEALGEGDPIPAATFVGSFEDDSTYVKLTGKVAEVCQKKGCWINVELENGETMRVTFKDYGFFVPKDLSGSEIVMEGKALRKVTPVDELQHFAKDAGKSDEEIAAITEPKEEIVFEAVGVEIPAATGR